jgi:hypothetical protein
MLNNEESEIYDSPVIPLLQRYLEIRHEMSEKERDVMIEIFNNLLCPIIRIAPSQNINFGPNNDEELTIITEKSTEQTALEKADELYNVATEEGRKGNYPQAYNALIGSVARYRDVIKESKQKK